MGSIWDKIKDILFPTPPDPPDPVKPTSLTTNNTETKELDTKKDLNKEDK